MVASIISKKDELFAVRLYLVQNLKPFFWVNVTFRSQQSLDTKHLRNGGDEVNFTSLGQRAPVFNIIVLRAEGFSLADIPIEKGFVGIDYPVALLFVTTYLFLFDNKLALLGLKR